MIELTILYIIFIIVCCTCIWAVSGVLSIFCGVPNVSSDRENVILALKFIKAKKGQVFYDLGCGKGNVLKIVAREFELKCVGVEISPLDWLLCKLRFLSNKKISVQLANLYKTDLGDVDIVYCYLLGGVMKKLASKFQGELKPGTYVISLSFPIPSKKPEKIIKTNKSKVYIYKY